MKKPELIKTMREDMNLIIDEKMSYPDLLKMYYAEKKKPQYNKPEPGSQPEPETKVEKEVHPIVKVIERHEAEIKMLKLYCIGVLVLSISISGIIIFVTRKK